MRTDCAYCSTRRSPSTARTVSARLRTYDRHRSDPAVAGWRSGSARRLRRAGLVGCTLARSGLAHPIIDADDRMHYFAHVVHECRRLRLRAARRADRAGSARRAALAPAGAGSRHGACRARARSPTCRRLSRPAICWSSTTRASSPRGCSATGCRAAARSSACCWAPMVDPQGRRSATRTRRTGRAGGGARCIPGQKLKPGARVRFEGAGGRA